MLNIHKGQYFTNSNNQKYIFLGYKNPNIIYCLDENFEETSEVLLFDVDFINSPLNEFNDKAKKLTWYYQCEEELENADLSEKLDTLLVNMNNDFKNWEDEVGYLKLDIRIKKISDLVKGKAFFSDQNQYYEVVGFLVETETFEGNKKTEENKGFFSIYHSKCDNLAPMTFFYYDRKDSSKFYNKGTNDFCIINETLLKESEIDKYIKNHNYNVPKLSNKDNVEITK